MKPTLIDRAIGVFSPRTAAQRMRYRVAMAVMQQHYDAAGRGTRTQGWRAPSGDANAGNSPLIRLRARDMVRNNAIARRAVAALVDNIVGDGIIPSVETGSDRLERQIQEMLKAHLDTPAIDAHGRTNLYGLQRLAVAGMIVDGEAILRRRPRIGAASRDLPLPFQVEALEPEWLNDAPRTTPRQRRDTPEQIDGIEFDENNRRVAYHLYTHHPDDGFRAYPETTRVDASHVAHLYRLDRPGQRRGVSWLSPALPLMADAYDYADAQLVRQKIAAMWVGFTKDTGEVENPPAYDMPETLQPGTFEHLPAGRDVVFSNPPPVEGYAEHMKGVQRMIAAALSVTYEELSGDLEGVNFSSARIGRMAMQRAISAAQWTIIIPALCEPLNLWLRDAIQARVTLRGQWRIKWTPPRFAMTDPAREIPAALEEIAGGLTSRQRKIREFGYDPEEIRREIAEDMAAEQALGLSFGARATTPAAPQQQPAADQPSRTVAE